MEIKNEKKEVKKGILQPIEKSLNDFIIYTSLIS